MLEAHDLVFSYPEQEKPLLSQLSLKLLSSDLFCLLGPSGSGKTTLLKLFAGLLVPSSGSIRYQEKIQFLGDKKEKKKFAREVGMSFQKGGLLDWLTVEENVEFALNELTDLTKEEKKKVVEESLNQVGLLPSKKLFMKELSGGMLKRVSLARTMSLNPKVLLLDDPTAGLDPVTGAEIVQLIKKYHEKNGATVLLVTSDLSVAFSLAKRAGFLWSGHLIFEGSPAEMKANQDEALQQFLRGLPEGPLTEVNHA